MPNIFDYAFAPEYAKKQDEQIQKYLQERATANAIQRSYNNTFDPKREDVSTSSEILKDPHTAFIHNLINTGNPGAIDYATSLYSTQQTKAKQRDSYVYKEDDQGNLWGINTYNPSDRQLIAPGGPKSAMPFGDSTMNERMFNVVVDETIGADDPRRLAARRWLGREKQTIDPATGAVITIPGVDLYGIDPYLTESSQVATGQVRTKDQIAYDSYAESAIPLVKSFNNYAKLLDTYGPSFMGTESAELKAAGWALLLELQKFNEFGVLNEGDVEALKNLIGDATSVRGALRPNALEVQRRQLKQLSTSLQSRLDAKNQSYEGLSVKTRPIPSLYGTRTSNDIGPGESTTIGSATITQVQ